MGALRFEPSLKSWPRVRFGGGSKTVFLTPKKKYGGFGLRQAGAAATLLAAFCFSPRAAVAVCPSGGTCWTGPSGVWNNAANWSNGVPNAGTNADSVD